MRRNEADAEKGSASREDGDAPPRAPSVDLERAARAIDDFLLALGHDPRAHAELAQTGTLVAKAFANELLAGYAGDPRAILSETMPASGSAMIVVTGIATTTVCPHHLLPATGVVHVGYLPAERIVGLGALGKLVHAYARRLALQETLGQDIADALVRELGARGAGCIVDLAPGCIIARGGRHHGARVVTHAWSGSMAESATERAELLASI